MLRQIQLKNFRQHEDRTFNFEKGLVAIRGANEKGKTTIIEAFLYALFGSKVLRDSLSDVVTWGQKEETLKVVAIIETQGRLFSFSRSKSGAECAYDGGLVTGQNEVSAFAAELLGGDAKLVQRLMLASQNNLRGALEEGPKAVAAQIEALADFDLFDRIFDAAEQKLLTGSPSLFEQRVRDAEIAVDEIDVTPPSTEVRQCEIKEIEGHLTTLNKANETLRAHLGTAEAKYQSAQTLKRMHDMAAKAVGKVKDERALHAEQLKVAKGKAAVEVDTGEIVRLKEAIGDQQRAAKRFSAYREYQTLNYPETSWEGSRESLNADIARVENRIEEQEGQIRSFEKSLQKLEGQRDDARRQICTDTTCPTCKQELKDKAAILTRNEQMAKLAAGLEGEIKDLKVTIGQFQSSLLELKSEKADLRSVLKSAEPFDRFLLTCGEYVTVDTEHVPPKLAWDGSIPQAGVSVETLKKTLQTLEQQVEAVQKAKAQVEALTASIEEDDVRLAQAEQALQDCPDPGDVEALQEQARAIGNEIFMNNQQIAQHEAQKTEKLRMIDKLLADHEARKGQKAQAEATLASAREELKLLQFNNALIKKVRAARPAIADKLWGLTLAAVSTMFSQMRGERSIVTKSKDGFSVNGAPVSSLSGSAKDVLGLAIRVALIKTFLPATPFIVLDEPSAACDDNRTAALLGFVATAGFDQTILVSHEAAAEAVSDQLITL